MRRSLELRQERTEVWEAMKAAHDAAEDRALTAEEQAAWERAEADLDRLDRETARHERAEAEAEAEAKAVLDAGRTSDLDDPTGGRGNPGPRATDEYRDAFRAYLRAGPGALGGEHSRALASSTGDVGGFLVAPEQFVADLIKAIDDEVHIRPLATIEQLVTAASLGVPSLDTDPSDADWTSEIATGAEDTAMKFGKRELVPHPLAKRIKVSNKLIRQRPDVEDIVRDRLAYKFAVSQEKGFLTGSGSQQPLGVFTASADGISTGRDEVIGSTIDITADGLIDTKFKLKAVYWRRARWLFHRDAMKRIRKLKDSQNQYLWQPGLASGQPDTILDVPYLVSEFAPNTFTTGKYVALIGDFAFYWIAEALDFQVQRLVELYAETNQVGFIGRAEVDGMPVLEEAFVRGKLA